MNRTKSLFLFVILHLISTNGQLKSQEYTFDKRIIYQMTYQTDSNDISSRKTMEMELLVNRSISLFQSLKQRQRDSTLYFHNRNAAEVYSRVGGIVMRPVNKFKYKILKNDNTIHVYDSVFGMNMDGKDIVYTYSERISDMDWKIKEDTIHFGNYICQRADLRYGNRNWTAWFAPEIPISNGPYKFSGLPGLIVRMSDDTESWIFDMVLLEKTDIKHAINFQKWHVFQEKKKIDLYRDRYEYQQNLPVITAGARPENGDMDRYRMSRERFLKSLENDNNWIELYP